MAQALCQELSKGYDVEHHLDMWNGILHVFRGNMNKHQYKKALQRRLLPQIRQ